MTRREAEQALRLGRFITDKRAPGAMRMSRAIQLCRRWTTHLGWQLAAALGWRPPFE